MAEPPKKPLKPAIEPATKSQIDDQSEFESELVSSLSDVLDLLALQVEHLQTSLDFLRLSEDAVERDERIRWHVRQIDLRQDRMDEVKSMILAKNQDQQLH
ncbi:MAG: hypothetical protein GKR90_21795 [Pseudomonadales bacterium]|nr:hypothetical protein [Pseudomonadales bacterium]